MEWIAFARRGGLVVFASAFLMACGVSQQQVIQMGQQEAAQVNAQLPILQDSYVNQYVK